LLISAFRLGTFLQALILVTLIFRFTSGLHAVLCEIVIFHMVQREETGMGADRKPEFFSGKDIQIGIIGCGYVGLPLALRFADVGQIVTGFDSISK